MGEVFHRAGWVMVSPLVWLRHGVVGIEQGTITYAGPYKRSRRGKVKDYGPGVIMPPFVNAHTHLGLSVLKGQVSTSRGFLAWVKELVSKRDVFSQAEIQKAVIEGVREVATTGTRLVADVGDPADVRPALKHMPLDGILFQEILGHQPVPESLPEDEENITFSLAGHALHTTPGKTLAALKKMTLKAHKPFSIHLAESSLETKFLTIGKGDWADFLAERGIDLLMFGPFGQSPVERAAQLKLLDNMTVAVHLLEVSEREVEILAKTGTKVVFCPRSNFLLHKKLPHIDLFLKHNIIPALGTDSLASCPSLSLLDEMVFLARNFPHLSPQVILEMGTRAGAAALGRDDLGTVREGKAGMLIYVNMEENSSKDVMERLLSGERLHMERITSSSNAIQ